MAGSFHYCIMEQYRFHELKLKLPTCHTCVCSTLLIERTICVDINKFFLTALTSASPDDRK